MSRTASITNLRSGKIRNCPGKLGTVSGNTRLMVTLILCIYFLGRVKYRVTEKGSIDYEVEQRKGFIGHVLQRAVCQPFASEELPKLTEEDKD